MIWRIRNRAVFAELATKGIRVRCGPLRMTYCRRDERYPLVGFAFGRKFGPAVERNRARRRVKAAFERAWCASPGPAGAYLLTGSRSLLSADFERMVAWVDTCLADVRNAADGADADGGGAR